MFPLVLVVAFVHVHKVLSLQLREVRDSQSSDSGSHADKAIALRSTQYLQRQSASRRQT